MPTVHRFCKIPVPKCRQYNASERSWHENADSTAFLHGPGVTIADSTTFLHGPDAKMPTVQRFHTVPAQKMPTVEHFWMILMQKCRQYIVFARSQCQNAEDSTAFLHDPDAKMPTVQSFTCICSDFVRFSLRFALIFNQFSLIFFAF